MSKTKKILIAAIAAVALIVVAVAVIVINKPTEVITDSAASHISLAENYLLDLNYEAAIAEYRMAIEINPKNAGYYIALAELYIEMRDTEAAIEVLEEGLGKVDESERDRIQVLIDELIPKPVETTITTTTMPETTTIPETTTTVPTTTTTVATTTTTVLTTTTSFPQTTTATVPNTTTYLVTESSTFPFSPSFGSYNDYTGASLGYTEAKAIDNLLSKGYNVLSWDRYAYNSYNIPENYIIGNVIDASTGSGFAYGFDSNIGVYQERSGNVIIEVYRGRENLFSIPRNRDEGDGAYARRLTEARNNEYANYGINKIKGSSFEDLKKTIEKSGGTAVKKEVYSEFYEKGQIMQRGIFRYYMGISRDRLNNSSLVIELYVSAGRDPYIPQNIDYDVVPDVVGLNYEEAKQKLNASGFEILDYQDGYHYDNFSTNIDEFDSIIVCQEPPAGSYVTKDYVKYNPNEYSVIVYYDTVP
jgi:tetratricopeptide (TPR) repeat protein